MPPVGHVALRWPQRSLQNEVTFGDSEGLPAGPASLFFMCTLCAIFPKTEVIQLEKWYVHIKEKE